MAGFEGITALKVEKVTPEHQPDAKWPLFLYELGGLTAGQKAAKYVFIVAVVTSIAFVFKRRY